MHIVIRLSAALILIAVSFPLFPYDPVLDAEEGETMFSRMNIQEWEFHEDLINLPGYPKQKNLVPIDIDAPDARFEYFIDPESIQAGDDGLTSRLTMIIESRTGYQNIFVERYRCDSHEYKTLAYGTGKQTFYEHHDPVWENIGQRGGTGLDYRHDLITFYLCDGKGAALQKSEILQRVRFPQEIPEDSSGF